MGELRKDLFKTNKRLKILVSFFYIYNFMQEVNTLFRQNSINSDSKGIYNVTTDL